MPLLVNRSAASLALLLLFAGGCDDRPADGPLRVFAASSLTEAVTALGAGFERAHPSVSVEPSFAGSQVLRLQIEEGAPADVFASADRRHMDALVAAGRVVEPTVMAHNDLVVIVPTTRTTFHAFEELDRAERLVIGDPSVPVGSYTEQTLARASERFGPAWAAAVRSHVVSQEGNVRGVRARVEMGEADAAIVYRTDAIASSRLRVVEIPEALNARAEYWIAVVAASPRRGPAQDFVDHVLGEEGQAELSRHGFSER
ncbi:MAG: molybdate ABC transporter substrate-binding protein [Sandaracinaceae bacterium]|nr:molybdate ABC transporter substrate-binding protein [Sandaracinaceae bacterium]